MAHSSESFSRRGFLRAAGAASAATLLAACRPDQGPTIVENPILTPEPHPTIPPTSTPHPALVIVTPDARNGITTPQIPTESRYRRLMNSFLDFAREIDAEEKAQDLKGWETRVDEALRERRFNILFAGKDDNGLTDTLMGFFLRIADKKQNPDDKDILDVISFPRDLGFPRVPDVDNDWAEERARVNEIYKRKGPGRLKWTTGMFAGASMHALVGAPMGYLEKAVAAFANDKLLVDIETINDPSKSLYIEGGRREIDGSTALKIARSRNNIAGAGNDYKRQEHQQVIIKALFEAMMSGRTATNTTKFNELVLAFGWDKLWGNTYHDLDKWKFEGQEVMDPMSGKLSEIFTAQDLDMSPLVIRYHGTFNQLIESAGLRTTAVDRLKGRSLSDRPEYYVEPTREWFKPILLAA